MLEIIYLHLFLKLGFGLYPFFLTVNPLDLLSETECCVGCLRFWGEWYPDLYVLEHGYSLSQGQISLTSFHEGISVISLRRK